MISFSDNTISFRGKIDIYRCPEMKNELLKILNANKETTEFQADFEKIEACDLAGLQLILSFKKTIENQRKKLKLFKSSAIIDSLVNELQMNSEIFESKSSSSTSQQASS